MAQAQGIYKQFAYKKQSAQGTPASGAGGQLLRRETATLNEEKDIFSSNEITSHQQYTGDQYGVQRINGSLSGVLSPDTYADFMGSVLCTDFAAVTAITGLSLTLAGAGPTFTVTRSAGSWLTDGIKQGHVVRITAGTYTGVARDINLLVVAVTSATVLTVRVLNGSTLSAQGPVATSTVTVIGKVSSAAVSSHTDDWYTLEEWHSDISRSRLKTDVKIGRLELGLPSNGNATIQMGMMGLDASESGSQVLTSPTIETSTPIMTGVNGYLLLNSGAVIIATSMNLVIDGQQQFGEATIGSKILGDIVKGDLRVSGSLTAMFEDETLADYFRNETTIPVTFVLMENLTDTANFIAFTMPRTKLVSASVDDGKKQIIQTLNFTAEYNGSGGAGVQTNPGIIMIQDSAA